MVLTFRFNSSTNAFGCGSLENCSLLKIQLGVFDRQQKSLRTCFQNLFGQCLFYFRFSVFLVVNDSINGFRIIGRILCVQRPRPGEAAAMTDKLNYRHCLCFCMPEPVPLPTNPMPSDLFHAADVEHQNFLVQH